MKSFLTGRDRDIPKKILNPIRRWFFFFCAALFLVLSSWYVALFKVGTDVEQGQIYRILYVHVPIALCAFLWVSVSVMFGILYFFKNTHQARWDRGCHSATWNGTFFSFLVLATGSLWGRPTWGVWWDWDPRLTASLVMFLFCCAYLVLRTFAPDIHQQRKLGSFIAILNGLNVPLVYFSVNLWRSLHQPQTFLQQTRNSSLDIELTLLLCCTALFCLSFALYKIIRLAISAQENLQWAREN